MRSMTLPRSVEDFGGREYGIDVALFGGGLLS